MPTKINDHSRQIRSAADLIGLRQERSITIRQDAINVDARTVEMAFATETPVPRYYGYEILDCSPKSVRLQRLRSKAPVLCNHCPDDQVGVIDRASMDADKIGRITARFSRNGDGQEVFNDIVDDIKTCTSVGYLVHEAVLEKTVNNENYYRVTDWEPYEVSIVSMPADINCGVGRNTSPSTIVKKEKRTMNTCPHCGAELTDGATCTCAASRAAIDQNVALQAREAAITAERQRVNDILSEGEKYVQRGGPAMALKMIADPSATVESFRAAMLEKINQDTRMAGLLKPTVVAAPYGQTGTALRYAPDSIKPFERFGTKKEEMAYRAGMWAKAIIFGNTDARRWCIDSNLDVRVMTEAVASKGGVLVPDELETAIVDLRVLYGAARRLCRVIPMGSASVQIPVRRGGTTAYFTGEIDSATTSDMTWGQANLVAKDLKAETLISENLAEDAVIDIAAMVANEHAQAFAAKEDACMILGDGTSTYGGIRGLNTLFNAGYATLKGVYACASNTDTFSEIVAAELTGLMGKLPSYARSQAVFLSSPTADDMVFSRLMAAGGGNTTITLAGDITPAYLGKRREVNEYMPADATEDLTNKTILLYGAFKMACLIGDRRGIRIKVLNEKYAESGQIGILGTERFDFNCEFAVGDTSNAGPVVALIGG